jgi:hypothetical protein
MIFHLEVLESFIAGMPPTTRLHVKTAFLAQEWVSIRFLEKTTMLFAWISVVRLDSNGLQMIRENPLVHHGLILAVKCHGCTCWNIGCCH